MQENDSSQITYIVLSAATKKELKTALSFSRNVPPGLRVGEAVTWECGNSCFLLLVTGIGPVNAALNLGNLLGGSARIKGVVNVGISGSFDLELYPLGTPVLVNEEIWPEFGLKSREGIDPMSLGMPLGTMGEEKVWDRIGFDSQQNVKTLLGANLDLPSAKSLTVAGVTGTREEASKLRRKYNAQLENMEGFALAWACSNAELPFVEIRTVSNLVGSREKHCWDMKRGLQELVKVCRSLLDSG